MHSCARSIVINGAGSRACSSGTTLSNWAPVPTYSEGGSYSNYRYGYGHRAYRPRVYGHGYGYQRPYRAAYRYGFASRHYGMRHAAPYHYGHRVLRRYY